MCDTNMDKCVCNSFIGIKLLIKSEKLKKKKKKKGVYCLFMENYLWQLLLNSDKFTEFLFNEEW